MARTVRICGRYWRIITKKEYELKIRYPKNMVNTAVFWYANRRVYFKEVVL